MKIKINGKKEELENEINITELLLQHKVEIPEAVSVQLNGKFVDKEKFKTTFVREDDEVDFLYFMGGGKS
ncbi:MAG: sulfur carrier protein ThiS [Candidatus Humimicrobiaceae bacterium]|jgi:sulfur carrier protein